MFRILIGFCCVLSILPSCRQRSGKVSQTLATLPESLSTFYFLFQWVEVYPGLWNDSGSNLEFYLEVYACAYVKSYIDAENCARVPMFLKDTVGDMLNKVDRTANVDVPIVLPRPRQSLDINFTVRGADLEEAFKAVGLPIGTEGFAVGVELREDSYAWAEGQRSIAFGALPLDEIATKRNGDRTWIFLKDEHGRGADAKVRLQIHTY